MRRGSTKRWSACLLPVILATALTACGSSGKSNSSSATSANSAASSGSSGSASKTPFTLLFETDLTGPTKVYGDQYLYSLEGAVAYVNQHGGIDGHPIKIVGKLSDNGDPTTAVSVLVKYLSENPKPDAGMLGTTAVDGAALLPISTKENLLTLGFTDGNSICAQDSQKNCPTSFFVSEQRKSETEALGQWMKARHVKKVGILEEADAYNQSETGPVQAELKSLGIATDVVTLSPTAIDATPQLSELHSAGVDAVYSEDLGVVPGYVAKARGQLGLTSLPLVFDPGAGSVDITKLAPAADLKNTYENIEYPQNPKVKAPGRTLMLKYAKPYGDLNQPLDVSAIPWTEITALAATAKVIGSDSPPALIKALNNLPAQVQNNPLFDFAPKVVWTPSVHENAASSGADFSIVPVGPLVNGMVQSEG
jgi:ABC-type branched-subunit amino acid transport system substrate-binding protein